MGLLAAKEVTLIILELRSLFHPVSILIPCGAPGTGKDVLKSLGFLQCTESSRFLVDRTEFFMNLFLSRFSVSSVLQACFPEDLIGLAQP